MAHFAKLGVNGKVIAVHGLDNDQMLNADGQEDESVGQNRLQQIHGWPAAMWIQTSFNTHGGKHYTTTVDGEGNSSTASWQAPITYPSVTNDGADPVVWEWDIQWDESAYQSNNSKGWKGRKFNLDGTDHADAAKTYDWNGSAWVEA